MTKFEKECYSALKRLKRAAKEGSKRRITRETVGAEAGKKPGAIRPIRHPELCEAIQQAETDRKAGILTATKSKKIEYRETVQQKEERIAVLEKTEQELIQKTEKQTGVILNLLHEINELEDDLASCKDELHRANNRINILMEKMQPKSV
jgi:flagellar motility protein MotE (MotC chaperone)